MYELRSSEFFRDRPAGADAPPGAEVRPFDLQPGVSVSLVSFQGGAEFAATAYNDHAYVHFSCISRGSVDIAFGGRAFHMETGSLLTSYAPGERFGLRLPGEYCNVELMVTPDALSGLAGDDYSRIGDEIRRGYCLHRNRNSRARDAAARLARLMEDSRPRRLLIHAAALEFLAWHLESYETDGEKTAMSARERRLLLAARERLLHDLAAPPTIAELARETGLNQLKLKRGFKTLFGMGVYALFQRERMDRARELLRRHGVTETAMMLGYSNVSHFGAAFRRRFGILPREIRRGDWD